MKINVKEIYKEDSWSWYDYQPMLDAFGKIVIQVDDKDYQGDSRLLYDESGKIGILIFGWVLVVDVMPYRRVIHWKKCKSCAIVCKKI